MAIKRILSAVALTALLFIIFINLFPWVTTGAFFLYTRLGCNTELIAAVKNSDSQAIKSLLDKGKSPDCVDRRDFKGMSTPLSIAANNNDAEIVNLLIDAGAQPEKTLMGHYGLSGTSAKNILISRAKLSQNDINTLLVSYSKSPAAMQLLIDRGADVNARTAPKGWMKKNTTTALYQASYNTGISAYSFPEGVKFLLKNGANPNIPNFEGNFPLGAAAVNRNSEVIKALIEAGAEINRESLCGFQPLIIASARGFPANIKILLDAGADPATKDNRSRINDSCYDEILMGQKRMMRLDQETADHRRKILGIMDIKNQKEAYESQRPELAAHAANRSIDGPYGGTALMWAAYSCDIESVKLLLDRGADVNARDSYDATALMWGYACDSKAYTKVIPLLLKAGADPDARDAGGKIAKNYLPEKN